MPRRRAEKQEEPRPREEPPKAGRARARQRRGPDVGEWVEAHLEEISSELGLDGLSLSREELLAISTKISEILLGESRPDMETLARRARRYMDRVRPLIALGLLELRESLTPEQLDYVLSAPGPWVLGQAWKIYREARRLGRLDQLQGVRLEWNRQWVLQRDRSLPPECPVCGFNSLMPDHTCLVCGSSPSSTALEKHYRVPELLSLLARRGDAEGLRAVLEKGYVIISQAGVKIPGRDEKERFDLELHLTPSTREGARRLLEDLERLRGTSPGSPGSYPQPPTSS